MEIHGQRRISKEKEDILKAFLDSWTKRFIPQMRSHDLLTTQPSTFISNRLWSTDTFAPFFYIKERGFSLSYLNHLRYQSNHQVRLHRKNWTTQTSIHKQVLTKLQKIFTCNNNSCGGIQDNQLVSNKTSNSDEDISIHVHYTYLD